MDWREQLRPASFRGVRFYVDASRTEQALFRDLHVFGYRDDATEALSIEDLGTGPRYFKFTAFLFGDDFIEKRDELEAALKQGGPGRLVHPTRGERTVATYGTIVTTEKRGEGGYCSIQFECGDVTETGLRSEPNTAAAVDDDLDAFIAATAAEFSTVVDETDVPSAYLDDVTSTWDDAQTALRKAHTTISSALGTVDDFTRRVSSFSNDLAAFASSPAEAAAAFMGAIMAVAELPGEVFDALERGVAASIAAGEEVVRSFEDMFDFSVDTPPRPLTTTNGENAERLRRAVVRVVRHGAVAAASRSLAAVPFASRSSATAALADIEDAFDGLLTDDQGPGGSGIDGAPLFESLIAARSAVAAHLQSISSTLPQTERYILPTSTPTLVVAHDLYGDATRALEVIARNQPPNPGEIPAGTDLEVRSA